MTAAEEPLVDMDRIKADHRRVQIALEDALWAASGHSSSLGTQLKQGSRKTFWEAVRWVLEKQLAVGDLSQGELLAELRKESGSVFWPLWVEDPKVHAECPRCDRRVVIDKEGLCPECAYEFEED